MAGRVTFVTPTYLADLDRFRFQRESMARCGIDIPHVAVVETEDVDAFADIAHRDGLTILSTADVLPSSVERRRVRGRQRRRRPWARWRVGGWTSQQFVKLAAVDVVDTPAAVCLDSDIFFHGRIEDVDFVAADGRLHLVEFPFLTPEVMAWTANSVRFLGLPMWHAIERVSYVNCLIPLDKQIVLDLRRHIETLHGREWADAMLAHEAVEYTTYGIYARYVHELAAVAPVEPKLCWPQCYTPDDAALLADQLAAVADDRTVKAAMVDSRLGIHPGVYRPAVERLWAARESSAPR